MILTYKEVELVKETKEYWINNVQSKFLVGYKAKRNCIKPMWKDGTYMKIGIEPCALCRKYLSKNKKCLGCPFMKVSGKLCMSFGLSDFYRNPSLVTCNNFISSLDKLTRS